MKKIKIAQIGISKNSHGKQIFERIAALSDIFEIAGYCLPENEDSKFPDRCVVFEKYKRLTLEEILSDPVIEAVSIETEEIYLTKYALMAAKHGKHIHCEKPGGTNLSDFEQLIDTVKKNGKVLHFGYMYRYNPMIMQLLEDVRNGKLGEIISVEAQMNCTHKAAVREWLDNFPGGMMFFLGCHLVDLILQIQGVPQNIIPLNKSIGTDGITTEDFGMALFEYRNGISFAKTIARERGGFQRRQLVVTGTEGTVEIKPLEEGSESEMCTKRKEYYEDAWHSEAVLTTSEPFDRYKTMLCSFAQMVRGEKENPCTPDYELLLYKTLLQACGEKI